MKRFLPIFLVVFLLFLASIAGFWAYKLITDKQSKVGTPRDISGLNQEVASVSDNPVIKGISPEKDSFLYELIGGFAAPPELMEERGDKAIGGKFIVKGDPLKREISVVIGEVSGQVNLGTYQGSFSSPSTWQIINTTEAYKKLKESEQIKLRVIYSYKGSTEVPEYAKEVQGVMDTLIKEFNSKQFNFAIPENFVISVVGVGIIEG